MLSTDKLQALGIDSKWLKPLEDTFAKYNINTTQRQANFIGQTQHESGNYKTMEENLHYSAARLMAIWPSRFPNLDVAEKYANKPEKIANKVYAGRMGNGDEESGDGWNYHGRGLIQLTGKENYANCGSSIGMDLLNNPNLLVNPEYAALSAGWLWNKKGLNELADVGDIETITKRINGGLLGLEDRKAKTEKALQVLG
jgi:putative chitinase